MIHVLGCRDLALVEPGFASQSYTKTKMPNKLSTTHSLLFSQFKHQRSFHQIGFYFRLISNQYSWTKIWLFPIISEHKRYVSTLSDNGSRNNTGINQSFTWIWIITASYAYLNADCVRKELQWNYSRFLRFITLAQSISMYQCLIIKLRSANTPQTKYAYYKYMTLDYLRRYEFVNTYRYI